MPFQRSEAVTSGSHRALRGPGDCRAAAPRGAVVMPAIDLPTPSLGARGDPCAECGAPLAADQRYCLSWGARPGPARVDWRAFALPAPPPAGAAEAGTASHGAFSLGALELVSPRVATAAVLALFGFGVFAGTLAGPRAGDTLASSRRVIVVDAPPAAAAQSPPAATPEPAPAPAQPDTSPAGDGGGSTSLADSGAGVPAQPIPSAPQAPAAPQDGGSGGGGPDTPATTQPAG